MAKTVRLSDFIVPKPGIKTPYDYLKDALDLGNVCMIFDQEVPETWIRPHLADVVFDMDTGTLLPVWQKPIATRDDPA